MLFLYSFPSSYYLMEKTNKKKTKSFPGLQQNLYYKWLKLESLGATQVMFTCSKSTIEILEKGVKYVQS